MDNPSVVDRSQDEYWLSMSEAKAMRENNYEWCLMCQQWEPRFEMVKTDNGWICFEHYFKLRR